MYDRKTWVILALCASLLAVNIYYQSKNAEALTKEKQVKEAIQKNNEAANAETAQKTTTAGLTVEPILPPTEEERVVLENDKIAFTLTNLGGGIKIAEFEKQFNVGSKDSHVQSNRFGSGPIGALAAAGETLENTIYTYKKEQSEEGKKAVYVAALPSGLIVKKTFTLNQGTDGGAPYLLDFNIQFENGSTTPLSLNQWSLYMGEASPLYQAEWPQQTGFFYREGHDINFTDGGKFKGGMFSSARSVISTPEAKIEFAGVTNQFFATVLRPKEPYTATLWGKTSQVNIPSFGKANAPNDNKPVTSVSAGLRLPAVVLKPAESKEIAYLIFIGPKHNTMLGKMNDSWGSGWGDVMQYGMFWPVSWTLNYVLNWYHAGFDKIAKNWAWGLAIILLTITVRLCIWPLHAKSTHTMKRMAMLKPEMEKLKEKYADDPNKLNTETMGLYRKFGINPLGGCLPMFIQIPIFFGFYRMLQYAVELRGQGFLWVHDLSQPDTLAQIAGVPINLLPVVMAISSFLQIKMTPSTGDKTQQKIIQFMPFMFFFFCYNFASALALYWTTQNIFSIGQTWLMSKIPEPELKPVKGAGKSWMQRMTERQAEYQKAQAARKSGQTDDMRDVTPDKKKRPPRTGG